MIELLTLTAVVAIGAAVILLPIPPATFLSALGASAACVGIGWLGSHA
jgi:hypothetical protein